MSKEKMQKHLYEMNRFDGIYKQNPARAMSILRKQTRQDLIKEILAKLPEEKKHAASGGERDAIGYNQAIQEVKKLLEEYDNTSRT